MIPVFAGCRYEQEGCREGDKMITRTRIYETNGTDPDANLALEEYLLFHTEAGECILYLWQNQHTVVIGKNQNCWKECDVTRLNEEGGHLARRLSGGGAVYHDLGNLNFTFLVRKEDYDLDRQLRVIEKAVESFGIPVEKSGRNDLLAAGRKFSGNAYYTSGDFCYHHGTLLVDVDTQKLGRYLTVSRAKLEAKGVDSVRSRVGNLKELCPGMTIFTLKKAMKKAFLEVYPEENINASEAENASAELEKLHQKYASWDWKYGRRLTFTNQFSGRFAWGGVDLELQVDSGIIKNAAFYTDALNTELSGFAKEIEGCPYEAECLCRRAEQSKYLTGEVKKDISELFGAHI